MSTTARKPVADVLYGLEIQALDDGWMPVELIALVKCLDEDGDPRWCIRATEGVYDTEAIGALISAADVVRERQVESWEDTAE